MSNYTGFISIDCGLEHDVSSYNETKTGLNFVSEEAFLENNNTGESKVILEKYKHSYQRQYSSLRHFPEGDRNCYKIQVEAATKYLIRAGFLYGDYDKKDMPPAFDLYLGTNLWDSVQIGFSETAVVKEIIHVIPRDQNDIQVCLVNTGHGIPFISTLEFRPLDNQSYQTPMGVSLTNLYDTRWDIGSSKVYR